MLEPAIEKHGDVGVGDHFPNEGLKVDVLQVLRGDLQSIDEGFRASRFDGAGGESLDDLAQEHLDGFGVFEYGDPQLGFADCRRRFGRLAMEVTIMLAAQGRRSAARAIGLDELTNSYLHAVLVRDPPPPFQENPENKRLRTGAFRKLLEIKGLKAKILKEKGLSVLLLGRETQVSG